MSTNHAVFGIYANRERVEEAVVELRDAGFRNTDTSIFFSENMGSKDLAHEKGSKAPEGFLVGSMLGAAIGSAVAWLVATGVWAIPDLGPIGSGGPVMALLAGLGVGGSIGGAIGALIGMSFPEYEAKRYRGRLRKEGILLSVHCDDLVWAKRAKAVLSRTGAEDIASTSESKADFAISDRPTSRRAEHSVARPITSTQKLEEVGRVEASSYDHGDHDHN